MALPRCELMFKDLDITPPMLTQWMLVASRWVATWWWVLAPIALAVAAAPMVSRRAGVPAVVIALAVAAWLACSLLAVSLYIPMAKIAQQQEHQQREQQQPR